MYGDTSYYYGARAPAVQYAATAPAVAATPQVFNARAFKIYGAVLALLAAATLSLGIANVVLTKEAYCNPWEKAAPVYCSTANEPYIWTWVGSGIWASVPIFFAGIFAMCLSSNPGKWTRVWALLIFLSAIVFAPGMCVLSSIEVWRGAESEHTFYSLKDGIKAGTITPDDNPYQAKFALPLVIAILAAIMFFMTSIITLMLCCCMHNLGIYLPQEIDAFSGSQTTQVVQPAAPPQIYAPSREVYYPSRPQVSNFYDINVYGPASDPAPRVPPIPTRYNPGAGNVMYGNFASRAQNVGNGIGGAFASEFFRPNPAYFWQ